MLLSKDATIREIHHRVKNNLQTIASLLRLQGRRLQSPEARAALEESERRIRSIAIVHETLSRDAGDVVRFDEIVRPLVRVVEETVVVARLAISLRGRRRRRRAPGRGRDAARGRAQRAHAERGRPRVPVGRAHRRAPSACSSHATTVSCVVDVRRRRRGPAARVHARAVGWPRALDRAGARHERARRLDRDAQRRRHVACASRCPLRRPPRVELVEPLPRRRRCGSAQPTMRCLASQALRSLRRSSSVVPPQTPASWLVARANSRHSSLTGQAVQIRRAVSIWSRAGPVVPMGKKTSGSESRQAERVRHALDVPIVGADPGQCHALPPFGDSVELSQFGVPGRASRRCWFRDY